MDFNHEWVAAIAATLTTVAFLPQVIKVYKTQNTRDISLGMFAIFTTGVAFWFVFGVFIQSVSVMAANFITFFLSLYVLIKKIQLG